MRRRTQLALFQGGDDLPLFAGSALDLEPEPQGGPAPAERAETVGVELSFWHEILDNVND
jgi:hypothetical protein